MLKKIFTILLLVTVSCSDINSQELTFNQIDKKLDTQIVALLCNKGYKKKTYYYDNFNKKDGKWMLYPWVKIDYTDYILINVSKTPKNSKAYNFLIVYSKSEKKIIQESGPFYDKIFKKIYLKKKKTSSLLIITTSMEDEDIEENYIIEL